MRSGVLTSVHAFPLTAPSSCLIFLAAVVGGSLALFCRARQQSPRRRQLCAGVSRDLSAGQRCAADHCHCQRAAGHPVSADHRRSQHGQAVGWPTLFQCGLCAHHGARTVFTVGHHSYARWKNDTLAEIGKRLARWGNCRSCWAAAFRFWQGHGNHRGSGSDVGLWIMLGSAAHIYRHIRNTGPGQSTPLSFWGMHVAHIGIAVCVVGITMVKGYETEKDVAMNTEG